MKLAQLCSEIINLAHRAHRSRVVPPPRSELDCTEKSCANLNEIGMTLIAPSQIVMERHRASTCENAVKDNEDRREGATPGTHADAGMPDIQDRREGATRGTHAGAVLPGMVRREGATRGAHMNVVPLNMCEGRRDATRGGTHG